MSLQLLDMKGSIQAKLTLAHLTKFYRDSEGLFCLHLDKKLTLLVEKSIRSNTKDGIVLFIRENGLEGSVQVKLVEYKWTYRGICMKFQEVDSEKTESKWLKLLMLFTI